MHDLLPILASLALLSFSPDTCRYLQVQTPPPYLAIAKAGLSAKPQPSESEAVALSRTGSKRCTTDTNISVY